MKEWKKPEFLTLGASKTEDAKDLGHGYDHVKHDHHCTCGLKFDTWQGAMDHENEMTFAGDDTHDIGCSILPQS